MTRRTGLPLASRSLSFASRGTRGFTLLELLVAMSLFAVLGIAVVSLLGQGLAIFSEGTAATTMQDRLQAVLPLLRSDLAAIQPVLVPEVPPPPAIENPDGPPSPTTAVPVAAGPSVQLQSGWIRLADVPTDWPKVRYVALVRTNARESEDPILRLAGTAGSASGVPLKSYDPSSVDSGTTGNLLAAGGLMEVVWIAVPEDPDPSHRQGPAGADSSWNRGILTLYRLFRAPIGGEKSLLSTSSFDTLAKIRAAGRPVQEGVLDFSATFRNVFSTSFTDGLGLAKASDGEPYAGPLWDSTRAIDKNFPLYRGADSLSDVRDDVFPAAVRVEVTLAAEGPFGFGRGETLLARSTGPDEKRIYVESVDPLYRPGPSERFLKVEAEWMSTTLETIDLGEKRVTVTRGRRGTTAVEHAAGAPVYVGATVSTDVPLVYKDRYARKR